MTAGSLLGVALVLAWSQVGSLLGVVSDLGRDGAGDVGHALRSGLYRRHRLVRAGPVEGLSAGDDRGRVREHDLPAAGGVAGSAIRAGARR